MADLAKVPGSEGDHGEQRSPLRSWTRRHYDVIADLLAQGWRWSAVWKWAVANGLPRETRCREVTHKVLSVTFHQVGRGAKFLRARATATTAAVPSMIVSPQQSPAAHIEVASRAAIEGKARQVLDQLREMPAQTASAPRRAPLDIEKLEAAVSSPSVSSPKFSELLKPRSGRKS